MKFKKILNEADEFKNPQDRLREIQRIGRKHDIEVLGYKEDSGEFRVIGSAKNLSTFYAELEKEDIIHLEEGFHKETWEEVYKKFQNIIDQFFPNEDEIESRVHDLYMRHQGEDAYEIAYDKWLEFNKEDLEESLEDDLSKYIQYEDTSWIDDLRDSFSEFEHLLWKQPSIDKIMELHDGMWIPLLKEYFKNTSNSLQEGLYIKSTSKVVSGIDGAHLQVLDNNTVPHTTMSFKAEYISGDSIGNVFNFVLADDIGSAYVQSIGENPDDMPTEIFEIDGEDEGSFFIFDLDKEIIQESALLRSPASATKVPKDSEYVIVLKNPETGRHSFFGRNYRFTLDINKAMTYPGKFSAEDEIKYAEDQALETFGTDDVLYEDRFFVTTVAEARKLQLRNETKAQYKDRIEASKLNEEMIPNTRSITIEGIEAREECPYLLGEDSTECEIANRLELTEDELWCTGWVGAVQNCNAGPFNSFDELDIYCYDREKGVEYSLPEIPEDIKSKFLAEVNRYIKNEPLTESNNNSIEDKIDDIQFVIENYLHNQSPLKYEFECVSTDGLTWEVCDYDEIVTIVFDPNWSEWVYTINGKGPYSHSSYEYILSDIESVFNELRN